MRVLLRKLGPDRGEAALELRDGAQVRDALRAAGIRPETVLVARARVEPGPRGVPAERAAAVVVPDDEPLRDGDELLVTRVVTGG